MTNLDSLLGIVNQALDRDDILGNFGILAIEEENIEFVT